MTVRAHSEQPSHASRPRGHFFLPSSSRLHPDSPAPFFQTKPRIGAPGDRFEPEAERVSPRGMAGERAPPVQRTCAGCAGEEKDELRRQPLEEEEELLQAGQGPGPAASGVPPPAAGLDTAGGVIRRAPASPAGEEPGEITLVPASQAGIDERQAKTRSMLPVRRRIRVGAVDDPAERQADEMAATVLGMAERPPPAAGELASLAPHPPGSLQLQSETGATDGSADAGPGVKARLTGGSGAARRLAPGTRAFYEPRFGLDLSPVRLHEGPQAAGLARRLNARAFTYGNGIWLGAGESESDRRLMAHELAHVAQAAGEATRLDTLRRAPLISQMDVDELGFTGDHLITSVTGTLAATGTKIDEPDGSAPVWTFAGTRHPVAYTKGTAPTLFGTFVVPSGSPLVPDVGLRVLVGGIEVGSALGQTIIADRMDVSGVKLDASVVGSSLADRSPTLEFEFTTDLGANWLSAGSATVRLFVTEGTPTPPGGDLREDVLNFGTAAALAGSSPVEGLRSYVQSQVSYDPTVLMPDSFTNSDAVLGALTVPHQCDSQAYLMRYLARSLGIAADVEYFWQGTSSANHILFSAPRLGLFASFQCDRPAEDAAALEPHFSFHAFTVIGGNLHDPTYGQGGLPAILERSPGTTSQRGTRSTFFRTTELVSSWTCAH